MTAWDFGISPSEYLRHKAWRVSDADEVSYENRDNPLRHIVEAFGTAFLDDLFFMALRVPNTDVDLRDCNALVQATNDIASKRCLVYVAMGVKPAGDVDFPEPVSFPAWLFVKEFPSDTCFRYQISRSEEIIDTLAQYDDLVGGACSHAFPQRIPYQDHRLLQAGINVLPNMVRGLLYGYPVADVLEFNWFEKNAKRLKGWYRENGMLPLDLLLHVPLPWQWSRQWDDAVGIGGEVRLNRAYQWALENAKIK